MVNAILRRTTFVVANAEESAAFYMNVFGWTKWYENKAVPVLRQMKHPA